jgi:hypothetical protein
LARLACFTEFIARPSAQRKSTFSMRRKARKSRMYGVREPAGEQA